MKLVHYNYATWLVICWTLAFIAAEIFKSSAVGFFVGISMSALLLIVAKLIKK